MADRYKDYDDPDFVPYYTGKEFGTKEQQTDPYRFSVSPAQVVRKKPPVPSVSKPVFTGPKKKTITGSSYIGGVPPGEKETVTEMTTEYAKPAPEAPELQEFKAPEYDEREVAKLTQQQAAPGVRSLRTTVQRAMTARSGMNPNVRRMTLRDALAGYGQGLESVMAGAASRASSMYGQRHATDIMEKQLNFQAQQRRDEMEFNKLMEEWRSTGVRKTTTRKERPDTGSQLPWQVTQPSFGSYKWSSR